MNPQIRIEVRKQRIINVTGDQQLGVLASLS
jgi:hypothetical protein